MVSIIWQKQTYLYIYFLPFSSQSLHPHKAFILFQQTAGEWERCVWRKACVSVCPSSPPCRHYKGHRRHHLGECLAERAPNLKDTENKGPPLVSSCYTFTISKPMRSIGGPADAKNMWSPAPKWNMRPKDLKTIRQHLLIRQSMGSSYRCRHYPFCQQTDLCIYSLM